METKPCRICGKTKPLIEFHTRSQAKDGRATACKPCAIAESNQSRMKPRPVLPEKACTMCGETKPLEDFVRNRNFFDGRNHVCKACLYPQRKTYGEIPENRKALLEKQKARYWKDPERGRDYHAKLLYGAPRGTYRRLFEMQGGKCAICESEKPLGHARATRFHFDHCHTTKEIRGLLCTRCNQAIGQLQDSPELLRKAAAYLEDPPARHLK